MRIHVELGAPQRIVELHNWHPDAPVHELLARLGYGHTPFGSLAVDAAPITANTTLSDAGLREGSVLGEHPEPAAAPVRGWSVALSGGRDVVPAVPVPTEGRLTVGRSPLASLATDDGSVSWLHCSVEREHHGVRLRDLGSTNGTLRDGAALDEAGAFLATETRVVVGDALLTISPESEDFAAMDPSALRGAPGSATVPLHRPPRPVERVGETRIVVPARRATPEPGSMNLLNIFVPLVVTGGLVLVTGDPRVVLFAAVSPILAVSAHLQQRRKRGREAREAETDFTEALERFRGQLEAAAAAERLRRRQAVPDPAVVVRRALLPSTRLWSRRHRSSDFLRLHLGRGDLPWEPPVALDPGAELDPTVHAILAQSRLRDGTVVGDLGNAGVIGIIGERGGALALARSLVMQATVHSGPADLTVGVFCETARGSAWDWTGWLPHTRIAGESRGRRWLSNEHHASVSALRQLSRAEHASSAPAALLVIDSPRLIAAPDSPVRELLGSGRAEPHAGADAARGASGAQRAPMAVSGIVLADTSKELPASCTVIVDIGEGATAQVHRLDDERGAQHTVFAGVSVRTAARAARALARFSDPEQRTPDAALPAHVSLAQLLTAEPATGAPSVAQVRELWHSASGLAAPIGATEAGVFRLDLLADGPHGLIGGTTGSGKSEFLRTFVVGLALHNGPERLNFLLIDFKGGAAFAACERLPHTIGTISNLDAQLADRALRALHAELERRQRLFVAAGTGVDTLERYLETDPEQALPRLVLVVDEFAMLAKGSPEVLESLVSVAAVGRTLGIHMILATQRPAGVVTEDILANTNLRIALRVQSREDSRSVIGEPHAAAIPRQHPGRAYVRLGEGDTSALQTALVTCRELQRGADALQVRTTGPFGVPIPRDPDDDPTADDPTGTDLEHLIDLIGAAHTETGGAAPRPIWPEALGEEVSLADLARGRGGEHQISGQQLSPEDGAGDRERGTAGDAGQSGDGEAGGAGGAGEDSDDGPDAVSGSRAEAIALVDEPELQRQSTAGWSRATGNLLLIGIPGSGTTTALLSVGLAAARATPPAELDLWCVDAGGGGLAPIARLPHTASYVGPGSDAAERQLRFLRHLGTELQRRRAARGPHRAMIVLIDGFTALREQCEEPGRLELLDSLARVYAEGPGLGIHLAISTTRLRAIPAVMEELTTQRWVFRLPDRSDYATLGIRGAEIPAAIPGRCLDLETRRHMHIARPAEGYPAAVAELSRRSPTAPRKEEAIGVLPTRVPAASLTAHVELRGDPVRLPVGLREDTLFPATLELHPGEHALIAGPSRSGKSTLLTSIGELVADAAATPHRARHCPEPQLRPRIWGICPPGSPVRAAGLDRCAGSPEEVVELLRAVQRDPNLPTLLLVDDAERIQDPTEDIAELLAAPPPQLHLVVAGRSTELRSRYGHWTAAVRAARCGILLQPDVDADGELLGARLPRRAPVPMLPGRGYLCLGGEAVLVHTAEPRSAHAGRASTGRGRHE